MKKNIQFILTILLFFMAIEAQAQKWSDLYPFCCVDKTKLYAKFLAGDNFLQSTSIDDNRASYQVGYILAGSLGYRWRCGVSFEFEYAYRRNAISEINLFGEGTSNNGHYQANSFMTNIIWSLPVRPWGCLNAKPFIGAGIGFDSQQMHSSTPLVIFQQEWNHFSWQLMAGLAFPILRNTEMTLEYKFHQGNCHFYNHTLGVGLIYQFGCFR